MGPTQCALCAHLRKFCRFLLVPLPRYAHLRSHRSKSSERDVSVINAKELGLDPKLAQHPDYAHDDQDYTGNHPAVCGADRVCLGVLPRLLDHWRFFQDRQVSESRALRQPRYTGRAPHVPRNCRGDMPQTFGAMVRAATLTPDMRSCRACSRTVAPRPCSSLFMITKRFWSRHSGRRRPQPVHDPSWCYSRLSHQPPSYVRCDRLFILITRSCETAALQRRRKRHDGGSECCAHHWIGVRRGRRPSRVSRAFG